MDRRSAEHLGRFIMSRWDLVPPVTAAYLPKIAYYIAEAGVPDDLHREWAQKYNIEEPVELGIANANRNAELHAEALLESTLKHSADRARVLQAVSAVTKFAHGSDRRNR